ncbi:MAG: type III-B CRISPR module RAMP protein Cmr4 [Petrimonas sp.]|jgi:CRISPR-associated protein Cmr4
MTTQAYLIQCITNLHVGRGDASYGIVDKLVQRDAVSDFPTIYSSSLKGSLREHFEGAWGKDDPKITEIFGKKTDNDDDAQSGSLNFLNADLVALPVRCSHLQFALTMSKQSVELINEKAMMLTNKKLLTEQNDENKFFTKDDVGEVYLEDDNLEKLDYTSPLLEEIKNFTAFNKQYAVVDKDKFKNYIENLPVIARNRLDENKNLWYEEIVPHQTIFVTYMIPKSDLNSQTLSEFKKTLLEKPIQIGANSSVGYGLCKFYEIKI